MSLHLASTHGDEPINWYALVSDYDGMHQEVYGLIAGHNIEPLYLSTPLSVMIERSPLVIPLRANDPIVDKLSKDRTLYFSAPNTVGFDAVLAQLRNRLQVQFSAARKGFLHYYVPAVASYFLLLAEPSDTADWLGILSGAYVYQKIHSRQPEWVHILGANTLEASSSLWQLTDSQKDALNEKHAEQEIQQWAETQGIDVFDWPKQKAVSHFCAKHQIESQALINKVHSLLHENAISLDEASLTIAPGQTETSIVEQLEKWVSREYLNV